MKLWFENDLGQKRVIADCRTLDQVYKEINKFIEECNAKKPAGVAPFKSYYTRIWTTPEGWTKFDVGSHTEFFIWEGSIREMFVKKNGEVEIK